MLIHTKGPHPGLVYSISLHPILSHFILFYPILFYSSHFKSKDGKKRRLDKKPCDVKINIGIMVKKEDELVIKRGATLPLTVADNISADDLLKKAVEKHTRFNKDVITSGDTTLYFLLFADKTMVENIPGSDEPFMLRKYKEAIDKSYTRITMYLCKRSDHLDTVLAEFDSDTLDNEEFTQPVHAPSKSLITTYTVPTSSGIQQDTPPQKKNPKSSDKRRSHQPEMNVVISLDDVSEPVAVAKESQCPICFKQFPVQTVEEHAANCSLWLEECDQAPDLCSTEEIISDVGVAESDIGQSSHKVVLQEQIRECARSLSAEQKRVTVRRKFIWDDFKAAMKKKIQPLTDLKVVFAGEPSVDDGGPKRELFSGEIMFLNCNVFSTFIFIYVIVELQSALRF